MAVTYTLIDSYGNPAGRLVSDDDGVRIEFPDPDVMGPPHPYASVDDALAAAATWGVEAIIDT